MSRVKKPVPNGQLLSRAVLPGGHEGVLQLLLGAVHTRTVCADGVRVHNPGAADNLHGDRPDVTV